MTLLPSYVSLWVCSEAHQSSWWAERLSSYKSPRPKELQCVSRHTADRHCFGLFLLLITQYHKLGEVWGKGFVDLLVAFSTIVQRMTWQMTESAGECVCVCPFCLMKPPVLTYWSLPRWPSLAPNFHNGGQWAGSKLCSNQSRYSK